MASKVPTATQINWAAIALQLGVLAALIFLFGSMGIEPMVGAVVYLMWSWGMRLALPREHRRGVALIKAGRFEEAIPHCEASADWFKHHAWVDTYRALIMLSPSGWSYREMALANRAFSLAQTGRGQEAMNAYEAMLVEFPDSALATTPLTMMRAAQGGGQQKDISFDAS
jgi:tetratricopeptide (TPR) repeat protein